MARRWTLTIEQYFPVTHEGVFGAGVYQFLRRRGVVRQR